MTHLRTSIAIAAALVVGVVAPFAQAAEPTPAELRALEIRGQALDRQCGSSMLSREAFRALCGNFGAKDQPTGAELKALEIRGQALNQLCNVEHVASVAGYRAVCGSSARIVTLAPPEASTPPRFDWNDFGAGAGAMFGLILVTGGIAAAVHYGRRAAVRPRTAS